MLESYNLKIYLKENKKIVSCFLAAFVILSLLFVPAIQDFLVSLLVPVLKRDGEWIKEKTCKFAYRPLLFFIVISSALFYFHSSLLANTREFKPDVDKKYSNCKIILFSFFVSATILLICSACSFLYAWNDWVDSNIFLTMGKSVLHGKVLYKDLYEQKGPILYFMHTFAYLITGNNFHGVYFWQILATTFFMFFSYKILMLFSDRKVLFLFPILAAFIYSSHNFKFGDCAEEFCIPFMMCAFYISSKVLSRKTLFTNWDVFVVGICAGCVCLIKFTICGFFIGWIIVPVIYYKTLGRLNELPQKILSFIGGIVVTFIPVLIYFVINNAVADFFNVYFFDNLLFARKTGGSIIRNEISSLLAFVHKNLALSFVYFVSTYSVIKTKTNMLFKLNALLLFFVTYFFIAIGGADRYYTVALAPFSIFALLPFSQLLFGANGKEHFVRIKSLSCLIAVVFTFSYLYSYSTYEYTHYIGVKKEEFVPYKFGQIMREYKSNPTMLAYNFLHAEFYNMADIIPNTKVFVRFSSSAPRIQGKQDSYITEGLCDFVITVEDHVDAHNIDLINKNYVLIAEEKDWYTVRPSSSYLYINKKLLEK